MYETIKEELKPYGIELRKFEYEFHTVYELEYERVFDDGCPVPQVFKNFMLKDLFIDVFMANNLSKPAMKMIEKCLIKCVEEGI